MDREPLVGLGLLGFSLASFNLAWGWSRPDSGVSRLGLVWVEVGTLDRGQLDMGIEGGTRREGPWSPSVKVKSESDMRAFTPVLLL